MQMGLTFFLSSNKFLVFRAGIHITLVRIVNREDPDRTVSLGLTCLSMPFCHATSARNFRKFSIFKCLIYDP